MNDLVTRAQIVLLARTLQVPPERVLYLQRLGAARLHDLQQRMAAVLFDQHAETFQRISRLVPIIPLGISIPLVQRLVPPLMTGRAAGAVGLDHPKKAAETVALLDTSYAADCAPYMDPRTVGQLADTMPPGPLVRIVNEVLRRRDYVTAGPFLAYATPTLIAAVEQGVHDDAGLIYSAAYAYSDGSLNAIVRQLLTGPRQRIPGMIGTVLAGPPDLQQAALSVFTRCEPDVIGALGDILFGIGSVPAIAQLVTTAIRMQSVPELLALTAGSSPQALGVLAANPVLTDPDVLATLVGTLDGRTDPDSWRGLFALAVHLDAEGQRRIAWLLTGLSEATVANLPARATEADLWPHLLHLLAGADTDVQTYIGAVWATLPPERRAGLQWHLHEHRHDTRLAAVADAIAPVSVEQVFYRRRQLWRHRTGIENPETDR